MVATSVLIPDLLEHGSVSGENRAFRATLTGRYATLLFDLFGQSSSPAVCAFIAAKPSASTAEFCLDLALELATSVVAQKQKVALIDGALLLDGALFTDLQPLPGSLGAGRPEVWAWPVGTRPARERVASPLHLQESLASLRLSFDYVLLQCPPTTASGMAVALASMADKAVLLVPKGRVRRVEIQAAQKVLMLRETPLVGCVLLDTVGEEGK